MPHPGEPFAERCRKAGAAASNLGAAALLASDPATVRWLTGRQVELLWGPLYPIAAGTHVVLAPDGSGTIVCAEDDADAGPAIPGITVSTYVGYTLDPLRPTANAAAAASLALRTAEPVAIEAHAIAVGLLGGRGWLDAAEALRALRMSKDRSEIELIARAAAVVSAGQRAFRRAIEPGIREIDLYAVVHAEMEREAGDRVPVLPDLLSGDRMAEVGRPPTTRTIARDELALCDLAARTDGYWADSCTTLCVGRATSEMRHLHDACRRALDEGIRQARPGTIAGNLDASLRGMMREAGYDYPHHSGHAVGTTYHDDPRIVPGSAEVLDEGMVIALEPAGFGNGIGCRLEHLVEVTASGGRVLTDYDMSLER